MQEPNIPDCWVGVLSRPPLSMGDGEGVFVSTT